MLRLGPEVLVGIPGEVFSGVGLEIKRRLKGNGTMVVGYANGCLGYIPAREAFSTPLAYATKLATHRDDGMSLAPNVGEIVARHAISLARSLRRVSDVDVASPGSLGQARRRRPKRA